MERLVLSDLEGVRSGSRVTAPSSAAAAALRALREPPVRLAELVRDSDLDAEPSVDRTVCFEGAGLTATLHVRRVHPRGMRWALDPVPCAVPCLECAGGERVDLLALGDAGGDAVDDTLGDQAGDSRRLGGRWFVLPWLPPGPVRLRVYRPQGSPIVTSWILLD